MSHQQFKTEVNDLLQLITHSLYSHSEIFLRELVSNSSDALDKLKYLTLTDEKLKELEFTPQIDIELDEENHKIFTVRDNGIGMNKEDLVSSLGTIARSGTKNFIKNLSEEAKKDSNLIGQFGVGFYSVFMIADKAEVISKKAGEDKAWKWTSDGKTGFDITEAERDTHGTTIILHLNENGKEYDNRWQVEQITKKYSNHIAFPIYLHYEKTEYGKEGEEPTKTPTVEQINSASALWRRSKNDLKPEDYNEFYKTISNDFQEPMHYIHTRAEGQLEYNTLFYFPTKAPMDMFQADYQPGVKLYVKRVFITDDDKELLPTYLRFVKGIIDSEDLPLNVSRELLQKNKVLANIKKASTKKILSEIKKLQNNSEKYTSFIEEYNRPLKEGLYSDFENKESLMELVRFKSTAVEGWTSFKEYKERMGEDQKSIYFITGDNEGFLRNSPLLEVYKSKNIEVLIMADEIDEVVIPMLGKYDDVELKAINKAGSADEIKSDDDKKSEDSIKPLIEKIKEILGESVKDVVASTRLTDSPSCVVADENDPTSQMAQMMKAMGQPVPDVVPVLEINPKHEIVSKLTVDTNIDTLTDVSFLLLEQALLVEGTPLKDPSAFSKRLNRVLKLAL
ncbi:molecular chaperone HtpG [Thiospirochaeta perfilievii]|uniref:Chaperone protein HtpG n=1 Tax=Thiospirochaeta perfilievii TaxID=252967 RepID=A0A5C1Q8V5_9SPIO|nr:molecular chaperone HtpG [Thiospirochaeta perfilievii]QEN04533.1 molecular chaperone HtpG [Thiospirochaeta perfilievii]